MKIIELKEDEILAIHNKNKIETGYLVNLKDGELIMRKFKLGIGKKDITIKELKEIELKYRIKNFFDWLIRRS